MTSGMESSFARITLQNTTGGETYSTAQHKSITLIGAGTIGLSFAALHLVSNPNAHITIHDPRPDLLDYIATHLPGYISASSDVFDSYADRLTISSDLPSAVATADIIQEQGPETLGFKSALWPEIENYAPAHALLWSSTSGIPASAQSSGMRDKTRLLVVHPYNPPHVMPLLEIVPSPSTSLEVVAQTMAYWESIGRTPVLLKKECTGFVANRLAFALLREACALVHDGVVGVEDLDKIVEASMGPRWAVAGPFKSYAAGGGQGGLRAFMEKIGGTVGECWAAGEAIKVGPGGIEEGWKDRICKEADGVYGVVDTKERDTVTIGVLEAVKDGREDYRQSNR